MSLVDLLLVKKAFSIWKKVKDLFGFPKGESKIARQEWKIYVLKPNNRQRRTCFLLHNTLH